MSLKILQERQTQLVLQRSQGKDIVEQTERELGSINTAIQQIQLYIEEQKQELEAKTSKDVLADVLPFPARDEAVDVTPEIVDVAEEPQAVEKFEMDVEEEGEAYELPPESDNDDDNNRTA